MSSFIHSRHSKGFQIFKKWVTWPAHSSLRPNLSFCWLGFVMVYLRTDFEMSSLKYVGPFWQMDARRDTTTDRQPQNDQSTRKFYAVQLYSIKTTIKKLEATQHLGLCPSTPRNDSGWLVRQKFDNTLQSFQHWSSMCVVTVETATSQTSHGWWWCMSMTDRQNYDSNHCTLQHCCTIKVTVCLTSTLGDKVDDMLLTSSL